MGSGIDSSWRTVTPAREKRMQLRAGVVGLGKQALEDHIPGLAASDGAKLVAICDENPEIVREQQYQQRVPGYTDRPGSTCPLNLLPLFQDPAPLFAGLAGAFGYAPGDFPRAEEFNRTAVKLPVWHREAAMPLAEQYIEAFHKVSANYRDLLG